MSWYTFKVKIAQALLRLPREFRFKLADGSGLERVDGGWVWVDASGQHKTKVMQVQRAVDLYMGELAVMAARMRKEAEHEEVWQLLRRCG